MRLPSILPPKIIRAPFSTASSELKFDTVDGEIADHRGYIRFLIFRISHNQPAGSFPELAKKIIVDRPVDENPFGRDAGLAVVQEL